MFEIRLEEPAMGMAAGSLMDRVNALVRQLIEKAEQLLKDNLPPWETVEAGVTAAYDRFIRPLSIPNFIDNIILKGVLTQVKKIYDELAESGVPVYTEPQQ